MFMHVLRRTAFTMSYDIVNKLRCFFLGMNFFFNYRYTTPSPLSIRTPPPPLENFSKSAHECTNSKLITSELYKIVFQVPISVCGPMFCVTSADFVVILFTTHTSTVYVLCNREF